MIKLFSSRASANATGAPETHGAQSLRISRGSHLHVIAFQLCIPDMFIPDCLPFSLILLPTPSVIVWNMESHMQATRISGQ